MTPEEVRALLADNDGERDALEYEAAARALAAEVERLTRERDEAKEAAGIDASDDLVSRIRAGRAGFESVRADRNRLAAEVEMLRGVGCDEDGDGPCGACIKCARSDRDRLAAALAEVRDEALLCGAPRVTRVAAMAVADLAATHDARVRAAYAAHLLAEWGASEPVAGWLRARASEAERIERGT